MKTRASASSNGSRTRNLFPILSRKMRGHPLVYLDNGATTQKPSSVLSAMDSFYKKSYANVHRGIHTLSEEATVAYEHAHENVADFIGASSLREIVFTRGTTDSFNMLSRMLTQTFSRGDEIIVSQAEHHSNLVPWQQLAQQKGLKLSFIPYDSRTGELHWEKLEKMISKKTKVVSLTHVSNVLGFISPLKKISKLVHDHNALLSVDAAQSVARLPINVKKMGVDFLSFSGHKMYGPTASGVLYGREDLFSSLEPAYYGGDMVREVTLNKSTWNDLPWKFEPGTPPIVEGIGLGAAVDFLRAYPLEDIFSHEKKIMAHAMNGLSSLGNITIYGPSSPEQRAGVLAFNVKHVHAHDLSSLLNEDGVAIRAGHHCAMPLMTALNIPASARASFAVYTEKSDIDALVEGVRKAQTIFK
ncbi:MAG: SufS family cysteine desulfurase [Candidatus Diapherotrites archaeon]|uniref:cysteine desulfurase n=1 Tax=Candidatus Iainarchaeum sp. TaxID=3101447 RepID=A0A8T4CBN8_9ARCH|nr:SufS family cysteine desulfurase [Candidatus Diapherotrites archaeon]